MSRYANAKFIQLKETDLLHNCRNKNKAKIRKCCFGWFISPCKFGRVCRKNDRVSMVNKKFYSNKIKRRRYAKH